MYRDVALTRIAGQVRRAREMMSDAETQLVDIGLHQVALQLQNLALELEEIHLDLLEPLANLTSIMPRNRRQHCQQDLPF